MQELKSVGCELPHSCRECPRGCGANRTAGERGLCGADGRLMVARAALHFWEEPPISGEDGSGTVFFAGCPLRCAYCQNADIALGEHARAITVERLAAIMGELEGAGALNINCVTPTHYGPQIREAVALAREAGMELPVLWNTGGYETVEAVRANRGLVDAYLTDFKYADAALARRYSRAADYPEVALAALAAMVEEAGEPRYDEYRGQDRLVGGVVVRHLMLPGALENSKAVVRLLHERFGNALRLSLMNQYTPVLARSAAGGNARAASALAMAPELANTVSDAEYEELLDYADALGVQDYFWQEGGAAEESFIPAFDFTGV
ncbi:radical SAM protein [Adlercreutzia caecimuris]|uniref:radical SAM protein n=1 Tax=Adlercreutzia caecimuris TaxID=671266 RepID=UPI00272B641C|nr:radical SAM protein [Adlercreutzia caecimuris]